MAAAAAKLVTVVPEGPPGCGLSGGALAEGPWLQIVVKIAVDSGVATKLTEKQHLEPNVEPTKPIEKQQGTH